MAFSCLMLSEYGVCFGSKVVLADITLELPDNGITVLMGPVGTGKSTLLSSVSGVFRNNQNFKSWGTASLFGEALGDNRRPILVKQHADAALINETVENCILRLSGFTGINLDGRKQFVLNALKKNDAMGLVDLLQVSMIDIPTVWQRIVLILGVVLAHGDNVLLMIDEPTYKLSELDARRMLDFLKTLGTKIKLLVVLHSQLHAKMIADDIVLLAGGRVQYHGDKEKFFSYPPNDIVKQFVYTGSVSLPSPDAKPEELADGIMPPPPLPEAALFVLNNQNDSDVVSLGANDQGVVPSTEKDESADTLSENKMVLSATHAQQHVNYQKTDMPSTDEPKQITTEYNKPMQLPLPSKEGVGLVADIGRYHRVDSRAPAGFSWIVPEMLAGCPCPGVSAPMSYDLDLLAEIGITYLITLTEEDLFQAELEAAGLRNLHLPIYDRDVPSIMQMHMLLFKMQKLIENGEVLAVHCLAGLGRTGTVLAAWMIKEGGLSSQEAIRRLRLINPGYIQSQKQEQFLVDFENDILRRIQ